MEVKLGKGWRQVKMKGGSDVNVQDRCNGPQDASGAGIVVMLMGGVRYLSRGR